MVTITGSVVVHSISSCHTEQGVLQKGGGAVRF